MTRRVRVANTGLKVTVFSSGCREIAGVAKKGFRGRPWKLKGFELKGELRGLNAEALSAQRSGREGMRTDLEVRACRGRNASRLRLQFRAGRVNIGNASRSSYRLSIDL
jgi:hypothetical protein